MTAFSIDIPHKFKIANNEYTIELVDLIPTNDGYIFGLHSCVRNVIKIATKIKDDDGEVVNLTEEQIKNTFWHEVFHAFNYFWNNEQDESLAQSFANFMREYETSKE